MKKKSNFLHFLARNMGESIFWFFLVFVFSAAFFVTFILNIKPAGSGTQDDTDLVLAGSAWFSFWAAVVVVILLRVFTGLFLKKKLLKITNPDEYGTLEMVYEAMWSEKAKKKILDRMYMVNQDGIYALLNGAKDMPEYLSIFGWWLKRNYFIAEQKSPRKECVKKIFDDIKNVEILHLALKEIFSFGPTVSYDEIESRYEELTDEMGDKFTNSAAVGFLKEVQSYVHDKINDLLHTEFETFALLPEDMQIQKIKDLYKVIAAARAWEIYDLEAITMIFSLKLNHERLLEAINGKSDNIKELLQEVSTMSPVSSN